MNLERWQELKERVELLDKRAEQAKGAASQLQAELKKEFDVGSVEEAERLLAKLRKRKEAAEKEADFALREFEQKWKGKLEELE